MIRIRTGSRLHFGLLSPFAAGRRRFGGIGLMIEHPGIHLEFDSSKDWHVEGPLAKRVQGLVRELQDPIHLGVLAPLRITIRNAAPEHVGLGTGTQLSLAVAQGLALSSGNDKLRTPDLARLTGRGRRSGIGLNGFSQGGLLLDAGKREGTSAPTLLARMEFPEEWAVLLILPPEEPGRHGEHETAFFAKFVQPKVDVVETLSALMLRQMVPALMERDFPTFAEAVYLYNRKAGEFYQEMQGGHYSTPQIASIIERLRGMDVKCVGQSSWGPTVFALLASDGEAHLLYEKLSRDPAFANAELIVTKGLNQGAKVERA